MLSFGINGGDKTLLMCNMEGATAMHSKTTIKVYVRKEFLVIVTMMIDCTWVSRCKYTLWDGPECDCSMKED